MSKHITCCYFSFLKGVRKHYKDSCVKGNFCENFFPNNLCVTVVTFMLSMPCTVHIKTWNCFFLFGQGIKLLMWYFCILYFHRYRVWCINHSLYAILLRKFPWNIWSPYGYVWWRYLEKSLLFGHSEASSWSLY